MDAPMQDEAAGAIHHVQNEENPIQLALRTPVILSHILRNLDEENLLTSSLVNKHWHYEARKTLKNHRKLLAVIKGADPCVHLKGLDGTISKSPNHKVIPFSGLKISVPKSPHSSCVGYQDPEDYYPYILSRLTLKHLRIHWHAEASRPEQSCAAVWLMRKLFASPYSRQLETLYIRMVPPWLDLYSPLVLPIPSAQPSRELLPNLRSLQLYSFDWDVTTDGYPYIDLRILQGAPKLEKLVMLVNGACADAVPTDKLKCIVNLRFDPDPEEEEPEEIDWFEKVALSGAKLHRLEVGSKYLDLNHQQFADPRYWQILRLLLDNSKDTLLTFKTDLAVVLKLATTFPLPCLKSLEVLHVEIDIVNYNHEQLGLLGYIYFDEMFPNLKSVKLIPKVGITLELLCHILGKEGLEGMLQQERNLSQQFTGELAVEGEILSIATVAVLHRMFPAIKGFCCSLFDADGISALYAKLWTLWPGLKSLSIKLIVYLAWQQGYPNNFPPPIFNLDASYCGISSEEADELQLKDPTFLDMVQVVPTQPAITCLRSLEKLILNVRVVGQAQPPVHNPELFFFSKVTSCLAFRRMPRLEVTLIMPDTKGFEHLTSHMNIISRTIDSRGRDLVAL